MFYVFAGDMYYPKGGLEDLRGSFYSYEEAKAFAENLIKKNVNGYRECEWYHIADTGMNMLQCGWINSDEY